MPIIDRITDDELAALFGAYRLYHGVDFATAQDFRRNINGVVSDTSCSQCFTQNNADIIIDSTGERVCRNCFDNNYYTCGICGKTHRNCDGTAYDGEDSNYACITCLENSEDYFYCTDCNDWLHIDALDRYVSSSVGCNVCGSCAEDYGQCEDCGVWIHESDFCRDEEDSDIVYCYDCSTRHHRHSRAFVYGYSFKPAPIFNGTAANKRYFGIELETGTENEDYDNMSSYSAELHDASDDETIFYQKEDGSIGYRGVEIVTHPCSKDYLMTEFPWTTIREAAVTYDYRGHDDTRCGMHIHVSREGLGETVNDQDATIAKLVFMVDRLWEKIIPFTRRRRGDIDRWASKPNANIKKEDSNRSAIAKSKQNMYNRYRAINLRNEKTIELRIFRSSLKENTIKATIQFVDILCDYAMTHSIEDCSEVAWNDLFIDAPDELNTYLDERGLRD